MERELRDRRDRAADRHDGALGRWPNRQGDAFHREVRAVIDELRDVASAADVPASDPVEVAKTYRWLGDAYFDLALGTDKDHLSRGAQAYDRAASLLRDEEAPVDKATLDFNYGNTLRGLSEGLDVGLLEAAHLRYTDALRTFRRHHLEDRAAMVEQQLRALEPQLRLVRKHAGVRKGFDRLKQLQGELESAGREDRDRIAREIEEVKRVPGRGDPDGDLADAFAAVREQFEKYRERFRDGDAEKIRGLKKQVDALQELMSSADPGPEPVAPEMAIVDARRRTGESSGASGRRSHGRTRC